jgi:serine/threonine protein kinase
VDRGDEPEADTTESPAPSGAAFGADSLRELLGDRYDGLELISARHPSLVYRARQTQIDRTVAIKLMLDWRVRPGDRLPAEARAQARISWHAHVLSLFEVGLTPDGIPVLVCEYAARGSIQDRLQNSGLGVQEALELLVQISDALAAAHTAGIIHCDIKPSNVLLAEDGSARLSDFGIARLSDATAPTLDELRGTLQYVAPEVLGGEPPRAAADVFAFAQTAWTMLEADGSTTASSGPAFLAARMQSSAPTFPRLAAEHPRGEALARVLSAAGALDPEQRPTMAELQRSLVDLVRSDATEPVVEAVRRPRPWRRIGAAAALLVAVGIIVSSVAGVWDNSTSKALGKESFCSIWRSELVRADSFIGTMPDAIRRATTPYDVVRFAIQTAPAELNASFDSLVDAARDFDGTKQLARDLSPRDLDDLLIATGVIGLTEQQSLLGTGTQLPDDRIPNRIRRPTLAWRRLLSAGQAQCGIPAASSPDLSALNGALVTRLAANNSAGLREFFADPRSITLFDEDSTLLVLELVPGWVLNVFNDNVTWFERVGVERPDLRRMVIQRLPEYVLILAAQSNEYATALNVRHQDWVGELRASLERLDIQERDRIRITYATTLEKLPISLQPAQEPR